MENSSRPFSSGKVCRSSSDSQRFCLGVVEWRFVEIRLGKTGSSDINGVTNHDPPAREDLQSPSQYKDLLVFSFAFRTGQDRTGEMGGADVKKKKRGDVRDFSFHIFSRDLLFPHTMSFPVLPCRSLPLPAPPNPSLSSLHSFSPPIFLFRVILFVYTFFSFFFFVHFFL